MGIPSQVSLPSINCWPADRRRQLFCIRMEQRLVEAFAGQIIRIRCAAFVKCKSTTKYCRLKLEKKLTIFGGQCKNIL